MKRTKAKMRVILVDAWNKEVREVLVEKLDLQTIYKLLRCDSIEAHRLPGVPEHYFYCDEMGKLRDSLPPVILLDHFWDTLRGSLLIFKPDGDEEGPATVPVQDIYNRVTFLGNIGRHYGHGDAP